MKTKLREAARLFYPILDPIQRQRVKEGLATAPFCTGGPFGEDDKRERCLIGMPFGEIRTEQDLLQAWYELGMLAERFQVRTGQDLHGNVGVIFDRAIKELGHDRVRAILLEEINA